MGGGRYHVELVEMCESWNGGHHCYQREKVELTQFLFVLVYSQIELNEIRVFIQPIPASL